jgi:flagellar hook-length control protein FliK
VPSVASQLSASQQLHNHQPNARSRADNSDRSQNSPFSELLDSPAPAPEPPPAPRHARADKNDAPRSADKSRKTDAPADRNTPNKTKDASDVPDAAPIKDAKDTKNADDDATAKDAKASGDAEKPADDSATTAATGSDAETKPDADLAAALQAILIDPTQPVVTTGVTVIATPQPVASDAPAADGTALSGAATQIDALIALQAAKQNATADEAKPAKGKKEDKADAKGDAKALIQAKTDTTADTKTIAAPSGQEGDAEQQNGGKAGDVRHGAAKPADENPESETRGHHAAEGAAKAGAAPTQNAGAAVTAIAADAAAAATAASAAAPSTGPAQPQTVTPAHIQAQLQAQTQAQTNTTAAVPLAGVAVEIATQASAGKQHFEIRLDPAELGRIDVKLEIDSDGNTTTRLVVERTETLELLKRDASQLERALQQAGLKTSDNAMEFSLRQQFAQNDDQGSSNTARIVVPDDEATRLPVQRQSYGRLLGTSGGLDIRV